MCNLLLTLDNFQFSPELIIVSAGYDCAVGCPEGEMEVTPAMFAHFVNLLRPLASGKLCLIQEVSSEYFANALRRNKANHWAKYS